MVSSPREPAEMRMTATMAEQFCETKKEMIECRCRHMVRLRPIAASVEAIDPEAIDKVDGRTVRLRLEEIGRDAIEVCIERPVVETVAAAVAFAHRDLGLEVLRVRPGAQIGRKRFSRRGHGRNDQPGVGIVTVP